MDQHRNLIKLALFGEPIKASLSPIIHQSFATQFELDIEYQKIETGRQGFPSALDAFQKEGGFGCNVTLPLKRDAWQLAADSSIEVTQAQAANTLIQREAGGWSAYSTDGPGLVADLTDNHSVALAGKAILVLGAGGATSSILGSLFAGGAKRIVLVNRNIERATQLAKRFATNDISVCDWAGLATLGSFDLVINATSLGHQGKAPALAASLFAKGSVCYDLNYFKASLPLKNLCAEQGWSYIDGLGMLVEQAAQSFFIWTNFNPDTNAVIKSCRVGIHAHRAEL
jgi:shikimate dehydrogenase